MPCNVPSPAPARLLRRLLLVLLLLAPAAALLAVAGGPVRAESGPGHDGDGGGDGGDDGGGDDDDSGDDDDDGGGRGRGRGGDAEEAGGDRSGRDDGAGLRVDIRGAGIEVRFPDGSRERIRDGRFERRDAAGTVTDRRQATGADILRLRDLAAAAGARRTPAPDPAVIERIETGPGRVVVRYSNGWIESVVGSRYRLTDPYGRRASDRPARQADADRLLALRR